MKAVESLHSHEWDFDKVPDSELVASCWWEYARESAHIRDNVDRARDEWPYIGKERYIIYPESWKTLRSIAIDGESLSVFLQSLPLQPNAIHVLPDRTVFCWPDKPRPIEWQSLTQAERRKWAGSFPAPWLSLMGAERQGWVKLLDALNTRKFVPVNLADSSQARLLLQHWQSVVSSRNQKHQEWYRRYFRRDESGKPYVLPGALDNQPDYGAIRPGISLGTVELLTLEIAWGQYTNDEIASYLREVLPSLRPESLPSPDSRGKTRPEIQRTALRDLGVMRLLNFSTVANLKNRCSAAADYFRHLGWLGTDREKNFSAARKRALRNFKAWFPHLPDSDLPKHATTKGGRGKL
jgi:hypothetical protein